MLVGKRHSRYARVRFAFPPFSAMFCREGEGGGGGGAGGGGDGGASGGGGSGDPPKKTFSQEQLDSIVKKRLEEERTKHQGELRKQLDQVEQLQKAKNLTEEQRKALEERQTELETALLTEKEKADKEKKKLDADHQNELKKEREEKEAWRHRYENTMITNEILATAEKHAAFNASQMVALIRPLTTMQERKDEKLKVIPGEYEIRVKARITEKSGEKTVVLDKEMTVDEYIAYMKTQEEFLNLFRSDRPGGTGYRPGTKGAASGENLTPAQKVSAGLQGIRQRR